MANSIVAGTLRGARKRVQLVCKDPSKAVQASKDECDINTIVAKYMRTGELPGVREVAYADISQIGNLQESLNAVIQAQESFMALPADVRRYFDNDPVKLVEFAQDPKNKEKAYELGLAVRPDPGPASKAPSQPAAAAGGQPATPPSGEA